MTAVFLNWITDICRTCLSLRFPFLLLSLNIYTPVCKYQRLFISAILLVHHQKDKKIIKKILVFPKMKYYKAGHTHYMNVSHTQPFRQDRLTI